MEVVVPQPAGGASSGRLETTYVVLYAVLEVLHKPSFLQPRSPSSQDMEPLGNPGRFRLAVRHHISMHLLRYGEKRDGDPASDLPGVPVPAYRHSSFAGAFLDSSCGEFRLLRCDQSA